MSSIQLADPIRGFSFQLDGPLDMRFDRSQELTAQDIVNDWEESELIHMLCDYGEERYAKQVAKTIIANRPLSSTSQLAALIAGAVPRSRTRIHPATRTFQALRITVNDELNALKEGLIQAVEMLMPGGRLAIISFHSLEDRIVKQYLKSESVDCICPPEFPVCTCGHQASLRLVTRKPIRPTEVEVRSNPRSRSARLRIAERIALA
jgi:16S rRNA (cytosine1402-N4)-methyltransferase